MAGGGSLLPTFSLGQTGGGDPLPARELTDVRDGAKQELLRGVDALPGFGAVPPKLIKKIIAGEYVDIWELLPETWHIETEGSCCHAKRPRRSLVTDINIWTECYATMAAVLSAAFP